MSLKLPIVVAERLRSVSARLCSSASPMQPIWLRASQSDVSLVSGSSPSMSVMRFSFIHSVRSSVRCCSTLGSISSMRFKLTSRWRSCVQRSSPRMLSSWHSVSETRCSCRSSLSPTMRCSECTCSESSITFG